MRRSWKAAVALAISASVGGCVSAKQRHEEQQQVERSIRTTTDPNSVKACDFVMKLRPDGIHPTPESQVASLVLSKPGVEWVILEGSGNALYSCRAPEDEPADKPTTPVPVRATPAAAPPRPVETAAASVAREPEPARTPAEVKAAPQFQPDLKIRVTNNPEAVKGCTFLESFVVYETVSRFQDDARKAGGNVAYVVATNQNGEVIGESYRCSGDPGN